MPGHDVPPKRQLPPPFDQAALKRFHEHHSGTDFSGVRQDVLDAVAGGSPYLRHVMQRDPLFAVRAFPHPPWPLL